MRRSEEIEQAGTIGLSGAAASTDAVQGPLAIRRQGGSARDSMKGAVNEIRPMH